MTKISRVIYFWEREGIWRVVKANRSCQNKPPCLQEVWQLATQLCMNPVSFSYFKTSPEIIQFAVMLYVRFPLSLRNVEDLLHEWGVDVSYESVRYWWHKFGSQFASEIKKRRAGGMQPYNWKWHLDEVFVKINGERHYLWRAVDDVGEVLESYVTKKRDKKAALEFMKKVMRRYGSPNEIVTDRLADKQVTQRWANKRAENSHLPFRRRERAMLQFRRMHSLQKFASIHTSFHNQFRKIPPHTHQLQAKPRRYSYWVALFYRLIKCTLSRILMLEPVRLTAPNCKATLGQSWDAVSQWKS